MANKVTINPFAMGHFKGGETPAHMVAAPDVSFTDLDGEFNVGLDEMNGLIGDWFQSVPVTIDNETVVVPAFELNGSDNRLSATVWDGQDTGSSWNFYLTDADYNILIRRAEGIKIPDSMTDANISDLENLSRTRTFIRAFNSYMTQTAFYAAIASLINMATKATDSIFGAVRLDAPANNPLLPVAVGANSPRLQKSLTADYAGDIAAAITAIGATKTELLITEDVSVSSAVVIPSTLKIVPRNGALFVRSGAGSLTINSVFDMPPVPVFSGFTSSNPILNGAIKEIYPQWFGATGDGATDDAPAFQIALDVANQRSGRKIVKVISPPVYYKMDSGLNMNAFQSVTLEGVARTAKSSETSLGGLVFTQTGSGDLISIKASTSSGIKNLKIIYSSPSFTGTVINFNSNGMADTHYPFVIGCEVRGIINTGAINASKLIYLQNTIIGEIRENFFNAADVAVYGRDMAYSNIINIIGNTFLKLNVSHIRNGGESWNISHNTFEGLASGQPGAYSETIGSIGPVVIENNWFGDVVTAGNSWIKYKGNHLVVRNNMIGYTVSLVDPAIYIDVSGGVVDTVTVENNTFYAVTNAVGVGGSASTVAHLTVRSNPMFPRGGGKAAVTFSDGATGTNTVILGEEGDSASQEISPTLTIKRMHFRELGQPSHLLNLTMPVFGNMTNGVPGELFASTALVGSSPTGGNAPPFQIFMGRYRVRAFEPADVTTGTPGTINIPLHGFTTGDWVAASSATTLPGGLSQFSGYYVYVVDVNNIQLASSYNNAITGTCIAITSQGTGTHTLNRLPMKAFNIDNTGARYYVPLSVGTRETTGNGTPIKRIKHGTATLVAGVVVVSDVTVSANSRIFINRFTDGGTVSASYSVSRSAGVSFTVTGKDGAGANNTADTSVICFQIIEP